MIKYKVTFAGSGSLDELTAKQLMGIGRFLHGSFLPQSPDVAEAVTPHHLTEKIMNTALAANGVRNLHTIKIEAM